MIRGHIEAVSRDRVSGWVHAEGRALRDASVLAFAGRHCVGAGRVDRFRPDLQQAGLGDGWVGFEIPIAGERVNMLESVVVRLEGSDACLLQAAAAVVAQGNGAPRMSADELEADLSSYRWMLSQGWIDQPDNDFLRAITVAGAYEYAVPRAARASGRTAVAVQEAAQHRLALLLRQDVRLQQRAVDGLDSLREALSEAADRAAGRPVAVLCGGAFALTTTEGAHCAAALPDAEAPRARHALQSYQALFLDARMPVHELTIADPATGPVTLWRAELASSSARRP